MSASNIWVQVLSLVEGKINRFTFSTWFKSTSFISNDGTALRVGVPNALFRDWFLKHYAPVVEQALAELDRRGTTVSYVPGNASVAVMNTADHVDKAGLERKLDYRNTLHLTEPYCPSSSKYRSRVTPAVRSRFLMMNTGTARYAGITSGRRTPVFV